jgi:hypothetical protein
VSPSTPTCVDCLIDSATQNVTWSTRISTLHSPRVAMVALLLFLEMLQSIATSETIRVCRPELSTGRDAPHYGQLDRH